MSEYITKLEAEFEKWKTSPPNVVQRATGYITKPVEFLLKPFIDKIAPLLENSIVGINNYLSKAIVKLSRKDSEIFIDVESIREQDFELWLKEKENTTKNLVAGGVTALIAEGAITGLGGFALIAVDIPASFSLILTFANMIALTYELDIYDEVIQEEIIKAITIGSETTIKGKLQAMATLRVALKTINTTTWKAISKAQAKTMPGLIAAIRSFLKKIGLNLTKRKATQLIPGIGAIAGAVINASWGLDSLEAVRQISRNMIIQAYKNEQEKQS